jgi:methyltransferase (TIGR00027 family)
MNKTVEYKPSKTAVVMALRRALANKEYRDDTFGPDYLAEYFLSIRVRFFLKFEKIRIDTKNKMDSLTPGLNSYAIARTSYFDKLFANALNDGIPQIVLMGAGYDSRAYRFAKLNRGTKIFELDIAPTQNRKKKCLKHALIDIPPQVNFVPINFNEQSLGDCLEKAGYKHGERSLFIWEGVTYYLDSESIDSTLEFIGSSFKDSIVAFDYLISVNKHTANHYYGVNGFLETLKKYAKNEELKFMIEDGEIESFLQQRGLKIVEHLDNQAIERKYLTDNKGCIIGKITGGFRFVSASPSELPL